MKRPCGSARQLLGRRVRVSLGDAVIVTGTLVGIGDDGEFEVATGDGFVHYCWPMLAIAEVAGDGEAGPPLHRPLPDS